jgi:hypothetical protein
LKTAKGGATSVLLISTRKDGLPVLVQLRVDELEYPTQAELEAPSLVIVSFAKTHETLNVKNNNGLDDVLLRPALDVATCSCTDSHLVWTVMESDEWAHGWCCAGESRKRHH